MNIKKFFSFLLLSLLISMGMNYADVKSIGQQMEKSKKQDMVEKIAEVILEKYVFPEIAQKIAQYLEEQQKVGAYEKILNLQEFLKELTQDMQEISNDRHLGIFPGKRSFSGDSMDDRRKKNYLNRMRFINFGFKNVDNLIGNVGLIVLDEFAYLEIDGQDIGKNHAEAALQLVSNSDALIFDLRDNFGGREEMALLFLNHFFEKSEHILTNIYRDKDKKEIWTSPVGAGNRLSKIPLYVLTSSHTVSGGEMFSYVLKNRKRATIIGEKTRGAAHKTHVFPIPEHNISIALPVGAVIDPITEADWEGIGVEPDISVSSGKAKDVAYKKALETLIESKEQRSKRYEREWALAEVDSRLSPFILGEKDMEEFVGVYKERTIFIDDGFLVYQKQGSSAFRLKPMKKDIFSFEDKGMFYVRIKFTRNDVGSIDGLTMLYDTGQRSNHKKTY